MTVFKSIVIGLLALFSYLYLSLMVY